MVWTMNISYADGTSLKSGGPIPRVYESGDEMMEAMLKVLGYDLAEFAAREQNKQIMALIHI